MMTNIIQTNLSLHIVYLDTIASGRHWTLEYANATLGRSPFKVRAISAKIIYYKSTHRRETFRIFRDSKHLTVIHFPR